MADLAAHRDYLLGEWQAAQAAPLSRRRAMLVALLLDAFVERLFALDEDKDDIIAYRDRLAARYPALRAVLALCAGASDVALRIEAVSVPLDQYGDLAVGDFMVSLYNDHSVPRLRLVLGDGSSMDMQEALAQAIAAVCP